MHDYKKIISIGIVLSSGGHHAVAHHAGVLDGLHKATGWDPRNANILVGTSAGSFTAITLRAGLSAPDLASYYLGEKISAEGRAITDRVTTNIQVPDNNLQPRNCRPAKLKLLVRELLTSGQPRPMTALAGILPLGKVDGSSISERAEQIHPQPWPSKPTWICAVNLDNGHRTVFGKDDVETNIGSAVQASTAIPGYFTPVQIGNNRYVDGGIHSTTNADLLAPLQLDLVIISSSKTASPGLGEAVEFSLSRTWHSRTLQREIKKITTQDTKVLTFQPTSSDLVRRDSSDMDETNTKEICADARDSAIARLAHPNAEEIRQLLNQSVIRS